MAEGTQTHKQKNEPTLKGYVRANVVIFFLICGIVPLVQAGITAVSAIEAGGAAALGGVVWTLLTSVLCNLLPTPVKETMVFWRVRDVLPGCRAFSKFGPKDSRVNMAVLKTRIGSLPRQGRKQNGVWYDLLKEYEATTPAIADDHREYLLFRDLTAVSLLIVPVLGGPTFFFVSGWIPWTYLGILLAMVVVLSLVARFRGNRLVCNVLALASRPAGPS